LKHFKKHLSLYIFFFVIGILWGKFFYFNKENRNALLHKSTIHLLAEEGFLPDDITESFAHENNVLIQVTTYKNKADLLSKFKMGTYDLVAFKSFYAEEIIPRLSKISYKHIKNKDSISVDFKNPPYDPANQFAIPLFWGVEKKSADNKPLLWIESIGIVADSKLKKEDHSFLDYILQTDITVELIRFKKVATTNKGIERTKNIESKLKPSYLRKISIRDLSFAEHASF
jgi:spermidine/putrescine-binding protein